MKVFLLLLLATFLFAEETSVSIAPSPINNAFYSSGGTGTSRHTATYYNQITETFDMEMLGYTYSSQSGSNGNFSYVFWRYLLYQW